MLLLSILSLFSKKLYIVFITLLYIKPVDIGIIWFFIFGLCLYYIIWTRFVSTTFTVYDVVFRVRCLWVQWFLVYILCWCFWLFCYHICSIFKSGFLKTDIYRMLLCLLISMVSMWFWWLNVSVIDKFTSITDVADVYFIMLSQKIIYIYLFHLFTLNHNYLTIFYLIFVLVTIIYLV